MSSKYKDQTVLIKKSNSNKNITEFLNDFRLLLNKYNAKIYSNNCELYIDNLGFIGNLEDNIETVEITDGDEVLYTSKVFKETNI